MTTQRTIVDTLETEQAGLLNNGDEFKFQPGGPGTSWQVYTFRGHVTTDAGHEWVDCFGGDPIRADHRHDRASRSFDAGRIRKEAQPPGNLSSKRRAAA